MCERHTIQQLADETLNLAPYRFLREPRLHLCTPSPQNAPSCFSDPPRSQTCQAGTEFASDPNRVCDPNRVYANSVPSLPERCIVHKTSPQNAEFAWQTLTFTQKFSGFPMQLVGSGGGSVVVHGVQCSLSSSSSESSIRRMPTLMRKLGPSVAAVKAGLLGRSRRQRGE